MVFFPNFGHGRASTSATRNVVHCHHRGYFMACETYVILTRLACALKGSGAIRRRKKSFRVNTNESNVFTGAFKSRWNDL